MAPSAQTPTLNLGFLTVAHEASGYLGGYLVTNQWGRPLEFRLSSPVQPNRVQQILYAETLGPYVCGELIGKTLVEKTGMAVSMVVTDTEAALELRPRVDVPVALVVSPPKEQAAGAPLNGVGMPVSPTTQRRLQRCWKRSRAASISRNPSTASARPWPRPAKWESPTVFEPCQDGEGGGEGEGLPFVPEVNTIDLGMPVEVLTHARFERPLEAGVREARLLNAAPQVQALTKLAMQVSTFAWRFPVPANDLLQPAEPRLYQPPPPDAVPEKKKKATRIKPPSDLVMFKDRLLYLLQPPLEDLFAGKQVKLPFQPYPYQLQGIAFLMPRHAALLADEMGLGKTAQAIIALRLLLSCAG